MCWRRSSKEWRQAVIEFIKAHPIFTVFCLIVGFYAVAFALSLINPTKDDYED
jgi:hypothetical protein